MPKCAGIVFRGKRCLDCKADGSSFTSRAVEQILERIGKKAGIKVSPPHLRHSAGTFWIKSGGSSAILQKILGHTTQSTTQLYIHLAGSDVKEWHSRFSPGDRGVGVVTTIGCRTHICFWL